jgi:hypothetical protein
MSDDLKELSEQVSAPVSQNGGRRKHKGGKKSLKKSKKGGKADKRRLSRRNKRSRRGGKFDKVEQHANEAVVEENSMLPAQEEKAGGDDALETVMSKQE